MTAATHAVGPGRPLFTRPFFDLVSVRLVSYRLVWLSDGDDYLYECTWSDGDVTMSGTLPWGRLDDAQEVLS